MEYYRIGLTTMVATLKQTVQWDSVFCILYVIGTQGLDMENIFRISNLNREEEVDILLEDIKESPPPEHMMRTNDLQAWRCTVGVTEERGHVQVADTVSTVEDCHVFWKACNELERTKRMSFDADEIDSGPIEPHSHSRTPPQVLPRNIKLVDKSLDQL